MPLQSQIELILVAFLLLLLQFLVIIWEPRRCDISVGDGEAVYNPLIILFGHAVYYASSFVWLLFTPLMRKGFYLRVREVAKYMPPDAGQMGLTAIYLVPCVHSLWENTECHVGPYRVSSWGWREQVGIRRGSLCSIKKAG